MTEKLNIDIVCFDCDSTLSAIEGIDELARSAGAEAEVAHLTQIAMEGEIALESVYSKRLQLIKPNAQAIEALAQQYIQEIVPGARELIAMLLDQGIEVHIISGGLRQAILPLADFLGIQQANVHAVDVLFHEDGSYQGFNESSPLARSGGKADICRQINANGASLAVIGDGQTDLESKQAGAHFIGFGGVISREAVKAQADQFVEDKSLSKVLACLKTVA